MKPTLAHPTWDQIHVGSITLAAKLSRGSYPDYIIGLSRGGLIPAAVISHFMNVPLMPISYSSKLGRGDDKDHPTSLPNIDGPSTLWIIDDIADSGHTLKEVAEYYSEKGHLVATAALYHKTSVPTSFLRNHVFWQEIPENSPWIIFPWEL